MSDNQDQGPSRPPRRRRRRSGGAQGQNETQEPRDARHEQTVGPTDGVPGDAPSARSRSPAGDGGASGPRRRRGGRGGSRRRGSDSSSGSDNPSTGAGAPEDPSPAEREDDGHGDVSRDATLDADTAELTPAEATRAAEAKHHAGHDGGGRDGTAVPVEECAFRHFDLKPELLQGIARAGYRDPSPIQAQAIPIALEGKDVIGQARTGTGKTAAFMVPALQAMTDRPGARICVVVPTRELAMQVAREGARLGHKMHVKVAAIYGGAPMQKQLDQLKKGANILVCTPGRLLDHMRRRTIDLGDLDVVILDEADRMFDLGFRDDIAKIMKAAGKRKQTLLFSATLSQEVMDLSAQYMRDPVRVTVHSERMTVDEVEQFFYAVAPNRKRTLLLEILKREKPERAIIFTRTKIGADKLAEALRGRRIEANEIHSDLQQRKREKILQGFRDGDFPFLIATDVAARGLDIPDVSHVFNYDVPQNPEDYVHRIGRTARMGRRGWAASFVCQDDGEFLTSIEKLINQEISYAHIDGFDAGIEEIKQAPDKADLGKSMAKQYKRSILGYRRTRNR